MTDENIGFSRIYISSILVATICFFVKYIKSIGCSHAFDSSCSLVKYGGACESFHVLMCAYVCLCGLRYIQLVHDPWTATIYVKRSVYTQIFLYSFLKVVIGSMCAMYLIVYETLCSMLWFWSNVYNLTVPFNNKSFSFTLLLCHRTVIKYREFIDKTFKHIKEMCNITDKHASEQRIMDRYY